MKKPEAPILNPADELSALTDLDLNSILEPIMADRVCAPIVRATCADELNALVPRDVPRDGLPLSDVLKETNSVTDTYLRRNTHPGFFGYVAPTGLPTDPLSHAMAAAFNQNVVGYQSSPGGATIERVLIGWLAQLVGYSNQADGVLLSGGSIANMAAIGAALTHRFGNDYRAQGLPRMAAAAHPVIICSETAHFSIHRAAALLGIGTNQVISVAVDDQFRMRTEKLVEEIEQNDCVVCVVASAGTTTTGAIDPLSEIFDICERAGIWLHVDAAYGGGGLMSPHLAPRYAGIENAHSVTMDLHKWFYMALDASVILYRDPSTAKKLFYEQSDYVQFPPDGPPEEHVFFHLGPELSRRFRALPVYIAMRHYGTDRLGRNVLHNVECAQYLCEKVIEEPDLELVAAPQLSICCFRFSPQGINDETVDKINVYIRDRVEHEGNYLMSSTNLHCRPILRVCILNHGTRANHIDGLVNSVKNIGNGWLQERR